jgi:hypothetical protein
VTPSGSGSWGTRADLGVRPTNAQLAES